MTRGELLLYWLTQVREGSWATFRRALSAIGAADDAAADDEAAAALAGRMRVRLSEMAHAEFFMCGGNRWRTFAPLLGGLGEPTFAVLTGGRTPHLVDTLAYLSETEGCRIEVSESPDGPDSIRVAGQPEAFRGVAAGAGLRYVPDLASALCAALEPIPAVLGAATPGAAPINWSVRSFDLRALRWVDGFLPNTAYEYRSRHGGRRHYVRGPKRALLLLDRRRAVYAAAHINRVALLSYDEREKRLVVPRGAPLPEAMARAAAASSGDTARAEGSQLIYGAISSTVAGVLMVVAGQRPPEPHWVPKGRSTV